MLEGPIVKNEVVNLINRFPWAYNPYKWSCVSLTGVLRMLYLTGGGMNEPYC